MKTDRGSGFIGARGTTLIEVMLAIVILAVIAAGGAAAAHMSRRTIIVQRNKRQALAVAHHRVELLRSTPYSDLAQETFDYNEYYVTTNQSGDVVLASSDPGEMVQIANSSVPMTSQLRYVDIDGGIPSFDGLVINVTVAYSSDPEDQVSLETYYADFGE